MLPAIAPGDWLLVDPTITRWPRRGAIVLFREPDNSELSIKRVAGGPGDVVPFADGFLHLEDDEAWLVADASSEAAQAAGFGTPVDSNRFGPVTVDALVGRVWFRYGPPGRRIGRIARSRTEVGGSGPVAGGEPADDPPAGDA